MSDITMCASKTCPRRACCHRFTDTRVNPHWQSYFSGDQNVLSKGHCNNFMDNSSYPLEVPLKPELMKKYARLLKPRKSGHYFSSVDKLEFWMGMNDLAKQVALDDMASIGSESMLFISLMKAVGIFDRVALR